MRMLRAISEIAAAMTVWSPWLNPASTASSRPACLAETTSRSDVMVTAVASATPTRPSLELPVEELEPFLEVECRRDSLEREAKLHHRKGDVGLNADDHGFGAAQPRRVGEVAQRAHGEGIHHVERRDVDDHALRPEAADALTQRHAQLGEVGVSQGRLNRGNEIVALFENRNFHACT